MYYALEVLTVMLAAVTMSLTLAHALELPGKLRLSQDQYFAVQRPTASQRQDRNRALASSRASRGAGCVTPPSAGCQPA